MPTFVWHEDQPIWQMSVLSEVIILSTVWVALIFWGPGGLIQLGWENQCWHVVDSQHHPSASVEACHSGLCRLRFTCLCWVFSAFSSVSKPFSMQCLLMTWQRMVDGEMISQWWSERWSSVSYVLCFAFVIQKNAHEGFLSRNCQDLWGIDWELWVQVTRSLEEGISLGLAMNQRS